MVTVANVEVKHRLSTLVVIFIIRWINNYFIASLQTTVLITSLALLAISTINFSKGDVSFLFTPEFGNFVKILGIDIKNGLESQVFISVILRLSLIVLILNTIAKFLISNIFHKNINLTRIALLQGSLVITLLSLLAGISCYAPQAFTGSETVLPVILFMWFSAITTFIGSVLWGYYSEKFLSFFEKPVLPYTASR